jgi:glycosyltransferase involved in cell wall biosynthesis
MLEALSAGALVIGSRTPPVEEVITHGRNGILCDFFDVDGFADAVVDALAHPDRYRPLRNAGRRTS